MRSRHNEEILSTTELMDALKKKMKRFVAMKVLFRDDFPLSNFLSFFLSETRDQNTAKTELENKIKEQLSGIERVHHTEVQGGEKVTFSQESSLTLLPPSSVFCPHD